MAADDSGSEDDGNNVKTLSDDDKKTCFLFVANRN